jgi:hypothetical protein
MGLLSVVGTVLMFAATVPPEDATSRLTAWLQWLGLDALPAWLRAVAGITFLAIAALYWIARIYQRSAADSDHWAERNQLEISVIANVSAGRESTAMPIDSDPENSRLRELKDAIEQGTLDATLKKGRGDMWAKVALGAFNDFVAASNKPYWIKVLDRWEARQMQAAASASTFSASLSVRDAVQELAPQNTPDIDEFNKAIRLLDTRTLRVLSERAIPLSEVGIQTPLNRSVTGILIRTEIADREVADERGHQKNLAKIQARGPMWAEVVKAVIWLIAGVLLALGGQKVL